MTEAGYPDGFEITFDCPNDRYVNDEAICTATVPMLERIGIKVTPNFQTKSLHFNKIGKPQEYNTSFYMLGWTPGSYDALNPLMQLMSINGAGPRHLEQRPLFQRADRRACRPDFGRDGRRTSGTP